MTDYRQTGSQQAIARLMAGDGAFDISRSTRDISSLALDDTGRLRVLPDEFWQHTTTHERGLFGVRSGNYLYPTVELVARLRTLIGGRSAIEIGAGNGVLAEALGITATDSFQQDEAKYRRIYQAAGQTIVKYGANVEKMPADKAVRRYKPDVVIAAWVTQKWDRDKPWLGGNEVGVVEEDIIANCKQYIFIGNEKVHKTKPIWALPHTIEYPSFVRSRAVNGTRDYIAIFDGNG